MLPLPQASHEQQGVIEELINNNNVIIDSVAGSGKTTCNLHIATHFKDSNILLLTYNSKLKIETREKIQQLELTNIETHSYHSFCVKYYNNLSFTDSEIIELLKNNTSLIKKYNYDIIILDEAQDISPLYFQLICKIFRDNNNINTKICILGDEQQSIFDFNGADQRFITFAENIFIFNNLPWKKLKLSTSFRITFEMSEFINKCMLKKDKIHSYKIFKKKPRYIICDSYHPERQPSFNRIEWEVYYYLDMGYSPNDIFILAPSIKNERSPIRYLENKLKTGIRNIPIFVPSGDDATLDKDILAHKLVFSTFHQVKGLERKVVLVLGFDNSYFKFYKKNVNRHICPNELYVATTRALEHLSLFHSVEFDYLDFLCKENIEHYCELIEPFYWNHKIKPQDPKNEKPKQIGVCELLNHLPQEVLDTCFKYLKFEKIQEIDKKVNIPIKTKQNGNLFEEVSELNGMAIPAYFEYLHTGNITIFENIKIENKYIVELFNKVNNCEFKDIINKQLDSVSLLQIANVWNTCKTGFLFKLIQITQYNWLSIENLSICVDRLHKLKLSPNALFEEFVNCTHLNIDINGYIDCISNNNNIYEFKCVSKLKKENYIQLALYKLCYEYKRDRDINNYYLYNILTDELVLMTCSYSDIYEMTTFLINEKYNIKRTKSDALFLLEISNIRNLYLIHYKYDQ